MLSKAITLSIAIVILAALISYFYMERSRPAVLQTASSGESASITP